MDSAVTAFHGAVLPTRVNHKTSESTNVTCENSPSVCADVTYIGLSSGFWPEWALPRPAWTFSTFPMSQQISQIPPKLDSRGILQKDLYTRLRDLHVYASMAQQSNNVIRSASVKVSPRSSIHEANYERHAQDNVDDISHSSTSEDTLTNSPRKDWRDARPASSSQNNAYCPRDCCDRGIVCKTPPSAKKSPPCDSEETNERPYLKFGVRAILAKHKPTESCLDKVTAISSLRDHVTPPSNEIPSTMVSQACPFIAPSAFMPTHSPYVHHVTSQPVLPWLPGAIRGKNRRGMLRRAVFSDTQRKALEKKFQQQKYIGKPDRKKLAGKLGLKDSQVKIWFQNRRMKWRNSKERQMLSAVEYTKKDDETKSSCDVIKPNESMASSIGPSAPEANQFRSDYGVTTCLTSDVMIME